MSRKTSFELVEAIGKQLSREPQSVTEVSEAISGNITSVSKWLETLKKAGFIEGREEGSKKLYWIPEEVVFKVETGGENQ